MKHTVYVASSWRNTYQPSVVAALRDAGHEVYDFRHPPDGAGFSWSEVDPAWESWTTAGWEEGLHTAAAEAAWRSGWPAHVWAGTTVENQAAADERIPHLLAVPAAVRFLSCEPLLGPVQLGPLDGCETCGPSGHVRRAADGLLLVCPRCAGGDARISWVIAGGESGPGSEPSHPEWFRSLRDQCDRAGVPFFFKQHGDWIEDPNGDRCVSLSGRNMANLEPSGRNGDGTVRIRNVGKANAGRLLDGREHNAFPASAAP